MPPCFDFYVVTRSYSSHPFLCALDDIDTQFKTTMKEEGRSDMIATNSVLQMNGSMNKATQVMMTTQGS